MGCKFILYQNIYSIKLKYIYLNLNIINKYALL